MHGTLKEIIVAGAHGHGWEPYIPWFFQKREVIRQLGHKPTLYVMRKHDGSRWLYRACTPSELSKIEYRDGHF
jgi:hypothetical protein